MSYEEYYTWQEDVPGFGKAAQEKLRNCTALVSRVGGLGGPLAFSLAAAGVGRIILAHGGELRPDDLNRQILMTHEGLGELRHEQAAETLRRFNPDLEIESVGENISEENAADLVGKADLVFSCAPLFEERLLMNREAMRQGKFFVDGAMCSMEGHVSGGATRGVSLSGLFGQRATSLLEAPVSGDRCGVGDGGSDCSAGGNQIGDRFCRTCAGSFDSC